MTDYEFLNKDVWDRTLDSIKHDEISKVPDDDFAYFNRSRLYECTETMATIVTPYAIDAMMMNNYQDIIKAHLSEILKKDIGVYIVYEKNLIPENNTNVTNNELFNNDIGSKYTFSNFVIGKSNGQAHNACLTCATNPGVLYNPLFIYGNSGLGKTHLLKAVANKYKESNPNKNIIYISGEDFVDAVFKASKEKTLDLLKESFSMADLLLVDDIQFIKGNKEKSQEIFFSIFTKLVNNKKQICIAADKKPNEINGLEERIITRFNQGLVVNIVAPEFETSYEIVKNKFADLRDGTEIDDDALRYIALNFSHDVRSLEGAITSILFYLTLTKINHIDIKVAKEATQDLLKDENENLTIGKIKKEVCNYYNVSNQQICSQTRTNSIATARHIAMYLCRKHLNCSFETIGLEFGNRDHSTVMSSYKKIEDLIKTNTVYSSAIRDIEGRIFQHES